MNRIPFLLALAACAPVIDQAAADAEALALVPDLVPTDAPYRLVRVGTFEAGAVISEGGNVDPDTTPVDDVVPEDPGFLFFLDLAPGTYFGHRTAWILVDDKGEATSHESQWWPLVDGVMPGALKRVPTASDPDVLDVFRAPDLAQGLMPSFDIPLLDLSESNAYLVVQGLGADDPLHTDASNTATLGMDFFTAYADARSVAVSLTEGNAATLLSAIDVFAADHDVVTLAIIAHGGIDYVNLGGTPVTAQQLRAAFQALPDTQFQVLLGSCKGGSFVDNLEDVANVRAVLTAVSATEGAEPDWDVSGADPSVTDTNASDVGSEWFSSVYAAAAALTQDNSTFAPVRAAAAAADVPHSTALLCMAFDGALGDRPTLGLGDDLDFSHVLGGHTPQRRCAVP